MTTVTDHVFDVTNRCPVCGGEARPRYRRPGDHVAIGVKRKCGDCGYTWDTTALSPIGVSPVDGAERSLSPG
jgi:hypothetical protein